MPIAWLFPFIDTVQFKDIQDNPIPELNDTARQVAVALDRPWIPLPKWIVQMAQLVKNSSGKKFDYIEGVDLSDVYLWVQIYTVRWHRKRESEHILRVVQKEN